MNGVGRILSLLSPAPSSSWLTANGEVRRLRRRFRTMTTATATATRPMAPTTGPTTAPTGNTCELPLAVVAGCVSTGGGTVMLRGLIRSGGQLRARLLSNGGKHGTSSRAPRWRTLPRHQPYRNVVLAWKSFWPAQDAYPAVPSRTSPVVRSYTTGNAPNVLL